ncbi:MAG: hypothetical protein QOF47_196 [Mycobacterium sp.]|nr:hypothetical protein [Mycobacterium sp.]
MGIHREAILIRGAAPRPAGSRAGAAAERARRASYRRRLGAFENYPSPLTHHGRHEERHHLYRCFVTPTFTREVDVLPEGRQLENGTAKCARGMQGSMHCETGEHGFVISYTRGQNW